MEKYLKVSDLADMLQVSRQTIYAWIAARQFPAGFRVGKARRWRREDVESHLAEYKRRGA